MNHVVRSREGKSIFPQGTKQNCLHCAQKLGSRLVHGHGRSVGRSGRDHVMTNGHLLPLSLFPSFLSAPSPFLLSLRTAGNEAISRARFRLCENFRSHFLIISPSSSTPLPHLAEKMAPDGPLAPLYPLFLFSKSQRYLQLQPIWFLSFVVKVTCLLFLLP